jgi:exodeoxyribonuclease VII large subunit
MIFSPKLLERNRVLSVAELNLLTRQLLEENIPLLWVRGEISNFIAASSGHWYFSLKDEKAQVRCVMFRHKSQYLDFAPRNGMRVEVLGLATLYEARGDFQLTLEGMRPAGLGALYEAFEKLKRKLEAEGLFDAAGKRAIPAFPRQIGVVTSPQAAALRDVLTTLERRMPGIPIVLYPTPVQGEGAGQKIAEAIKAANTAPECDVLILCRGGGSIEDLWAFNEEVVARAIAASALPVVSGIGHETDFTIADFVADSRAATPTAAAQQVTPDRQELARRVFHSAQRLQHANLRYFERAMQSLDFLQRRLKHPKARIEQQAELLHHLRQRLLRVAPEPRQLNGRQTELARRLQGAMQRALERNEARLQNLRQHLIHLDPKAVLSRGYSFVRDESGAVVMDSRTVPAGSRVKITLAHGELDAEVKNRRD